MRDFRRRIPRIPANYDQPTLLPTPRAVDADADVDALLGSTDIYAAINGRLLKNLGRASNTRLRNAAFFVVRA